MGFLSFLFAHPNDFKTLEGDIAFKVVGRTDSMNMYILNSTKPCTTNVKKNTTYNVSSIRRQVESTTTFFIFGIIPIATIEKYTDIDNGSRIVKQYVELTDEMSEVQDHISTLVSSTKEIHRTNRLYTQREDLEENTEVYVVPKIIETYDSYILGWKIATV